MQLVDHEGGSTTEASDETSDTETRARKVIFISFRVEPDAPIAEAMKDLLESSIEPSPDVFVSSAGGLRPSSTGSKPQLQHAVQRASAFVALITQASKEREWIFYEAGAAWGLGQLYAPVLVDTLPSDLPSTIADFQATRANKADEVRRLVDVLASAVGGKAKPRFKQRYRNLEKVLEAYQARDSADAMEKSEATSPRREALRLLAAGKTDEANLAFDKLEEAAGSPEELMDIRMERLLPGKETGIELLEKLETFDDALKSTPQFLHWRGFLEPKPLTGIADLEAALKLASPGSPVHRSATRTLIRRRMDIGQEDVAQALLQSAIRSNDRALRCDAVSLWLDLFPAMVPTSKFFLLRIAATAVTRSNEFLRKSVEIAIEERWPTLVMHLATIHDDRVDSPTSAHELGRACHTLEFPSLAFRGYIRAAKGGISVAKANLASLLSSQPVPAAGLEHIDGQTGPTDADSSSFPHRVRAKIEETIEAENKRAAVLREQGKRIIRQFSLLVDLASQASEELLLRDENVAAISQAFRSVGAGNRVRDAIEGKEGVELARTLAGFNVWTVTRSGATIGFVHLNADGSFVGFHAPLASDNVLLAPVVGATPHDVTSPGAEASSP